MGSHIPAAAASRAETHWGLPDPVRELLPQPRNKELSADGGRHWRVLHPRRYVIALQKSQHERMRDGWPLAMADRY